jgi:hypothetical protein
MVEKFPMYNQLEKFSDDLDLINKTVSQLNKDLEMLKHKIIFSGNSKTAFDEITNQLCEMLSSIQKKPSSLSSLLYRVDISEKQLGAIAKNYSGSEFIFKLAEAILYREFVKVSIKNYYKQKS